MQGASVTLLKSHCQPTVLTLIVASGICVRYDSGVITPSIYIASDHGGLELKTRILAYLTTSVRIIDLGTNEAASVDYPDFADRLCSEVLQDSNGQGILICGTGIGISIRANRHIGIRAALVTSELMAEMAKAHNDANVLCIGGRTTSLEDAIAYIKRWLSTSFEGGRHQLRLDKLDRPT